MEPLTIIGTGQAGYGLAREYRKIEPERPLRLISADAGASYYKPNLSKSFHAGRSAADLIVASAENMAQQLNAEILTEATVQAIQPDRHLVVVDERELGYSQLVLACGAEALIPPLSGAQELKTVNSLEGYARLGAALEGRSIVTIIGAGLIGCEFANDLAAAGFSVTVIDLAPHPLARFAPPSVGDAFAVRLAAIGVRWELNTSVSKIDVSGIRQRIELANGKVLHTDLVLCAVGQRPRTALAALAGLSINTGIVVDEYLRTSHPRIYALGDCAEIFGKIRPFIAPITNATKALARTLAGIDTAVAFPPTPIIVKTPACPTVLMPPEDMSSARHWAISGSGTDLEALCMDPLGRLLGFALTGQAAARKLQLLDAMTEHRQPLANIVEAPFPQAG